MIFAWSLLIHSKRRGKESWKDRMLLAFDLCSFFWPNTLIAFVFQLPILLTTHTPSIPSLVQQLTLEISCLNLGEFEPRTFSPEMDAVFSAFRESEFLRKVQRRDDGI